MPIPTTAAPRIRATGKTEVSLVQKAGKPAQMAVYDATGKLVGLIDPKDLKTLVQADDDGQAKVDAAAAKVTAQHPAPDPTAQSTVVADLQKNAEAILKMVKPRSASELVDVRKATGSLSAQWKSLLEAVGPSRAMQLQTAVAMGSLTLMDTSGHRIEGARAINIAKKAVCQAAVNRRVI